MTKKEQILGIGVSVGTERQILDALFDASARGEQSTIIAINPEKIMKARQDEELKTILNESTIGIPDGVGVLIGSKLQKGQVSERVTGVDMMELLCKESGARGESVFLYGAKPGTAEQAAANLQKKYPDLQVAGILDGYIKEESRIIETIQASKASILFVALGSPTQEHFIRRNMHQLRDVHIFQGVGGSFDVFSGNVKRAPSFFRKFGIEWLYRLMKEPKRLVRQLELPKFLFTVLLSKKTK